jgi:hypothetical protein
VWQRSGGGSEWFVSVSVLRCCSPAKILLPLQPKTQEKARQYKYQVRGNQKKKYRAMPDKAAAREKRFLQCEKCSSLCCHLCLKKFVTAMESQKIIQSEFWWMEYAKKWWKEK